MDEYCHSNQRWSDDEDNQLLHLYNIEKLNIGEICKQHKRYLGGIIGRLRKKGIISFSDEARGYKEFITSDEYEKMKHNKHLKNIEKQGYKNDIEKKILEKYNNNNNKDDNNILITIKQKDYDELKEQLNELKSELSDIKSMIRNLAIYDFD
tara:strand:- start:163 stop:618 length:456 start_codon:yes stop_codon:yes gene_type:complete